MRGSAEAPLVRAARTSRAGSSAVPVAIAPSAPLAAREGVAIRAEAAPATLIPRQADLAKARTPAPAVDLIEYPPGRCEPFAISARLIIIRRTARQAKKRSS